LSELPTSTQLRSAEKALRRAVEAAMMLRDVIDAAIRALDIRGGDADLEDGGDSEYSLGAPDPVVAASTSTIAVLSQEKWSAGAQDADREAEHDGREPDDEV
jgi:hypothetical protein